MDIIFLGRVIPVDIKEKILKKRRNTMSESAESLQWKLIEGINSNTNNSLCVYNFLPVQSWPKSYSDPYIKKSVHKHTDGTLIYCLPFLNVQLIKRFFMGKSLCKRIKRWAKKNSEEKIIISYSLTPEFLKAVQKAKKINKDIHACAIVADLPEYTVLEEKKSFTTNIYLKWMKKETHKRLKFIDSFALLTEQMADRLVLNNQKYIVMEGVSSTEFVKKECISNTIVYAGTLHKSFGVKKLIEAFNLLRDLDARLVLCGIGDYVDQIKKLASIDSRITYLGQVSREEVLSLLASAKIIINPRNTKEEFTKYSFPSKNLEALSSGVPFIAYKLPGIPDEYDAYINYPTDDSAESLAKLIEQVQCNYSFYLKKALEAKTWINANKSKEKQTKRILDMIKECI